MEKPPHASPRRALLPWGSDSEKWGFLWEPEGVRLWTHGTAQGKAECHGLFTT